MIESQKNISYEYENVAPYEPGKFYKRELPCILKLLKQVDLSSLEAIVIDGHCYIDNNKSFGLGGYLWEALDKLIPIIGVAKKQFINTEEVSKEILRGESKTLLYVSSIDFELKTAIGKIKDMHGDYRIPTILKLVDREHD